MLSAVSNLNRYNSPYSTSCTSASFSLDQNAVKDWDGYLVNSLAGTEIINAATSHVRTTVGIPGSEPALDSKLSRIATGNAELNRMRTTLLLGGNDIREIDEVSAVTGTFSGRISVAQAAVIGGALTAQGASQFNSTLTVKGKATFERPVELKNAPVSAGAPCAGYSIGSLARSSTGAPLSCQSGGWTAIGGGAVASLGGRGWSCDPTTGKIEQWGSGGALGNDGTRWENFPRVMSAVYNASVTAINLPSGSRRGGDMDR